MRQKMAEHATIAYTVVVSLDGCIFRVDSVPEEVARNWLWSRVCGGVLHSSQYRIMEVTPRLETNGEALEHAFARMGLKP